MLEQVVDEASYNGCCDFFDELFNELAKFLHRCHPLTQNYCGGVGQRQPYFTADVEPIQRRVLKKFFAADIIQLPFTRSNTG